MMKDSFPFDIVTDPEAQAQYTPHSYIVDIPLGKYTKENIEDTLTVIFGDPIHKGWHFLYVNVRDKRESYKVLLRGRPKKKFTRVCLEYPCRIERIID